MNRKDFGKLVCALRREHLDHTLKRWTQKQLAVRMNFILHGNETESPFNEQIIGAIERGERLVPPEEMLILAEALHLTSGERREFFAAANGIDKKQIALQVVEPLVLLDHLLEVLGQIQLPSFMVDSYTDVIAANWNALHFYKWEGVVAKRDNYPKYLNMMDAVFSPEFGYYQKFKAANQEPPFPHRALMVFRVHSLQYRATPYFNKLTERLLKYKAFRRYWQFARFEESDRFVGYSITQDTEQWGVLNFYTTLATVLTKYGELNAFTNVPLDKQTTQAFADINEQTPPGFSHISPWPEKEIPQ